jgi:hypothetical protein
MHAHDESERENGSTMTSLRMETLHECFMFCRMCRRGVENEKGTVVSTVTMPHLTRIVMNNVLALERCVPNRWKL